MIIKTHTEITHLKNTIILNASKTHEQLKSNAERMTPLSLLEKIKFSQFGFDPIKGTELNFVEQLNQMFSDLVVLEGAEQLLSQHPGKAFQLNLGPRSGFDIESIDGDIVAECFAVTTATSNNKLQKDSVKLLTNAPSQQKYIFFYSHNDSDEKLQKIFSKYPNITFRRIHKLT